MVFCDTDLYAPTRTILSNVHERLAKGGVIVFDQWNNEMFSGEGLAANEFLKEHGDRYEIRHVPHARQPNMFVRKINY